MDTHDSGQVAGSAAEIYETFFVPALFAGWPVHVLEAAGVEVGDVVLDVACGTGVLARRAREVVGEQGGVTGVDINDDMLAVARKTATEIQWDLGPAEALPYRDGTFDRVVSQFGLMFFQGPVQAIREMHRVARPGGAVAVAVWGTLAETPGYRVVAEMLSDLFGPEIARSVEAPYALGDLDKLDALFQEAGVGDASLTTLVGQATFDSVDTWLYTDIKGWTLADLIDDRAYERLRREAPRRLNQFVREDGTVAFAAPAHIAVLSV